MPTTLVPVTNQKNLKAMVVHKDTDTRIGHDV